MIMRSKSVTQIPAEVQFPGCIAIALRECGVTPTHRSLLRTSTPARPWALHIFCPASFHSTFLYFDQFVRAAKSLEIYVQFQSASCIELCRSVPNRVFVLSQPKALRGEAPGHGITPSLVNLLSQNRVERYQITKYHWTMCRA